ncbi:FAD-dependent oxidoreductase [bacterium]|nr:FAD-dependent oxidoreductase [bacterium]
MTEKREIGSVLVVGAGIAGIKASLELAEIGYKVLLIDSSPHIGGILAKLDHQFPTDHCGICRMLPMVGREYASQFCMRKGLYHENIEILPFTDLKSVSGDVGNFSVELLKQARYVDTDRCTGSGERRDCIEACPVEVNDEFNHNLTKRKAIYQVVPHNVPQMLLIDRNACGDCQDQPCVSACPNNAINLNAQEEAITREVDAIILATGTKLYNPTDFEDAQSYFTSPDVVSSLAFERILSPSGTFDGVIRRPSDGKPANRIAWIQCMGSRNRRQGREYCSSICCMFALKEAVLAKEKGGTEVETTIFYMDMRTFGKDYYRYREHAVDEHGVRLIRCRVQEVLPDPDGTLKIRYFDPGTNSFSVETFDLVVMSTGQVPFEEHKKLSKILNLDLNINKLLPTDDFNKVKLPKPGIFICGSLMGLTNISEAVASGIAAAGEATKLLTKLDVSPVEEEAGTKQPSSNRDPARVIVVLSTGLKDKADLKIDISHLLKTLQEYKNVESVHVVESVVTNEGLVDFKEIVMQSKCNRLLIGASKPHMYQTKLKRIAEKAGFNPSLIEVFDFMGVVHRTVKSGVTNPLAVIIREIRPYIENLKLKPALNVDILPIRQTALVVGGGITGMYAALSLAERGTSVHLVEQSEELGGYAGREVEHLIDGLKPVTIAKDFSRLIFDNDKIEVHLNSQVVNSTGILGNYCTQIRMNGSNDTVSVKHGVTILATGNKVGATTEYQYGQSDKILTSNELNKGLTSGSIDVSDIENVVMIQCVGSREKGNRDYCSRICCLGSIYNALMIKEKNPETRVFILYRDIVTYGFYEKYYTEARQKGVIFVNYSLDNKPKVEIEDGKPIVTFRETILDAEIELPVDLLVLATGIDADESNQKLADTFNVSINEDGFFLEADSKWRPIEFNKLGIYVAGVAHSPMTLKESIVQAEAAAQKSYGYLSGREVHIAREISIVHDSLCARCKKCIDVCSYNARSFDGKESCIIVDAAACQACGMCSVTCQNNAAEVLGWSDKQIMATIDAKLMDYQLLETAT